MNYKKACEILDLNAEIYIEIVAIKRQYKLMALMHHPDKNKSPDASSKFQEINEAYQYLLKNLDFFENDEETDEFSESDEDYFEFNESTHNTENLTGYRWILYSFLKNITK
jgi:DnaJ-class molecular chaperone